MIVTILAEWSVLMMAVVFFLLSPKVELLDSSLSRKTSLMYVVSLTFFCVLLLYFSVFVDGVRYDYRFLMYALAMRYLGPKITLPSIFFVTLFHYFFWVDSYNWRSLLFGFFMILTLTPVSRLVKKIKNEYWEIALLSFYELFVRACLNLFFHPDIGYSKFTYFIVSVSGILMIIGLIWLIKRITKLNEAHYYDYLTKLKNSRRFYIDLSNPVMNKEKVSLSIIDLDYFKKINDTYGHLSGDKVLIAVTRIFQKYQSEWVTFYRIGGEEFACVISPQNKLSAAIVVENIRKEVEELVIPIDEKSEVSITLSIGSTYLSESSNILQAINEADQALYTAKKNGRNRVIISRNKEGVKENV